MEVKNLCKAYGDLPVLENVSFTVGVGVTALWGPSGVGKTTLLRILLGLEKPDSGELMGTAVRWSAVFQEDRLLEGLDALGNLRFALGTDYEEAKAAAMLTALGLSVPQVTKIFLKLREMGVDVPADVYTVPYAVKMILEAKKRRDAGESLVLPRVDAKKGGAATC